MQHMEVNQCSKITDAGLRALTLACPNLLTLHLDGLQKLQGAGLAAAASSCGLITSLSLERCGQFDNWTYQAVSRGCRNLRYLNLNHCPKVTDDAIKVRGVLVLLRAQGSVDSRPCLPLRISRSTAPACVH
jgi:F-box and leucine-rich repeat protein GRR1